MLPDVDNETHLQVGVQVGTFRFNRDELIQIKAPTLVWG